MSASGEKVIMQIHFEIAEIDRLLAVYADLLAIPLDDVWAQFKREFVDFADSLTMDK